MKRCTIEDIENNQFYQMPKFLFDEQFKKLSSDARILYMLLRDRYKLSASNNWINEFNEVFLIYTREDMSKMLGVSAPTALKAFKQLIKYDLVEEDRQGINKPNLIYLSQLSIENTGHKYSLHQDTKKLRCNKTDSNKTDKTIDGKMKYRSQGKYNKLTNLHLEVTADMAAIEINNRKGVDA